MSDLEKIYVLLDEVASEESQRKDALKKMICRFDQEISLLHEMFIEEACPDALDDFFRRRDDIYED